MLNWAPQLMLPKVERNTNPVNYLDNLQPISKKTMFLSGDNVIYDKVPTKTIKITKKSI